MHFSRAESGKETLWSQTLKNWRRWTRLNSTPEGSMQVLTPPRIWKLHIPSRRWNSQNLWERTASENIHLHQGSSETRRRTRNSWMKVRWSHSPTAHQDDSTQDDEEAKNDFWTTTGEFIYRHHGEPRVKLYMPREESFPIPLKYIDVTRKSYTSLYVILEKTDWRLLELGWRKRIVWCMSRIHKICHTKGKTTGRMLMVRGETYKETNNLSSWWCMARYVEIYVRCSDKESKTKMGYRDTKARQCLTIERNIHHLNQTTKNSSSQWKPLVESWKFRCQQQCLEKYR